MKILSLFYLFSCVSTIFGLYTDPKQLEPNRQSFVGELSVPSALTNDNFSINVLDYKPFRLFKRDADSSTTVVPLSLSENDLKQPEEIIREKTSEKNILGESLEELIANISILQQESDENTREMKRLILEVSEKKILVIDQQDVLDQLAVNISETTEQIRKKRKEYKQLISTLDSDTILYNLVQQLTNLNNDQFNISGIYTHISQFIQDANITDANILNIKTIGQLLIRGDPVTVASVVGGCLLLFIMGMFVVCVKGSCKKKKNVYFPIEVSEHQIDKKPIIKNSTNDQ
uniref:Uncharacterized protein n=1 Tax=viral metagenome TaxID=1070528 RepID=A0A6C0JBI5_9ZZZZ